MHVECAITIDLCDKFLHIVLNKLIKKLDKRAEKADKNTPNSARHALKRRVDSTPSVSRPPENAPAWAVATESRCSSIASSPSDATAGEDDNSQEFSMPQQMTPEAPPGVIAKTPCWSRCLSRVVWRSFFAFVFFRF